MKLAKLLSAPAKKMDVPLLDECLKAIDPVYEAGAYPNQGVVWARIAAAIPQKRRLSRRQAAVLLLAALLLLSLIGAALAYFYRDIFNFTFDAGWEKSGGTVQESAYKLRSQNLAHLSLAHTDIDVLEAVYDGHELRVVYSLWWRDAKEPLPMSEYTEYIDTGCFVLDGVASMCDWIEVNGQDAFFSDIHTVPGEKPGQALFYLQTNLFDWNIEPKDELVVGLPLLLKEHPLRDGGTALIGASDPRLMFTVPVIKGEGLYFKAAPMESVMVDGHPMRVVLGRFSPVSSVLRLEIADPEEKFDPKDYMTVQPLDTYSLTWTGAVLCDMDLNPLGLTSIEAIAFGTDGPHSITLHFSVTPPAKWPPKVQLVRTDEAGNLIPGHAVVFELMPDGL